eukprot:1962243-Amphidinium_carterae.1
MAEENTRIVKATQIDDTIAHLTASEGSEERILARFAESYALLGHDVDRVKSLVSTVKGHFLNRLYADGRKVISAAKIASRAQREYESRVPTFRDLRMSILPSQLGA